jgi:hypothetical protein
VKIAAQPLTVVSIVKDMTGDPTKMNVNGYAQFVRGRPFIGVLYAGVPSIAGETANIVIGNHIN